MAGGPSEEAAGEEAFRSCQKELLQSPHVSSSVVRVDQDMSEWPAQERELLSNDLQAMGSKFGVDVIERAAGKQSLELELQGPMDALRTARQELDVILEFYRQRNAQHMHTDLPSDLPADGLPRLGPGHELRARLGVAALPGEGRTLVALAPIPAGSCILLERPALVASSRDALEDRAAAALAAEPRALAPAVLPEGTPEARRLAATAVASYSFEFLDGANMTLFRIIGVLNHACATSQEANCCLSVPFDAGSVAEDEPVGLLAVRPIAAGEPLRMPYLCPFAPPEQLHVLQQTHDFCCRCSTCRAEPVSLVVRCCAACGAEGGAEGSSALRRCSGCQAVLYCSVDCQRRHRHAHKAACWPQDEQSESGFLQVAESEYNEVMAASDAALSAASDALRQRRRFHAESQLDDSLQRALRFLDQSVAVRCRQSVNGAAGNSQGAGDGGSWRLSAWHPFAHYARGNLVKQALTRLAMRHRLRGKEPPGGCGALAERA
eukprot:CAMPEP_0195059198 /NCGR_PEP_ID=MMETSP0448-20130528/6743_1 /TAXON_ID=66468 /ORGANISM="Heterocapsa triquestra, Strain CCMP 448" /LENGTH=492 /DNA_ID=CAMNT_0040089423 /DNA_START=36 /DNA_END=1510 /DNA_ORIENTATION=+